MPCEIGLNDGRFCRPTCRVCQVLGQNGGQDVVSGTFDRDDREQDALSGSTDSEFGLRFPFPLEALQQFMGGFRSPAFCFESKGVSGQFG